APGIRVEAGLAPVTIDSCPEGQASPELLRQIMLDRPIHLTGGKDMKKALESLALGMVTLATASCATTPPQSPTVNVTGNWVGDWVCDNPANGSGVAVLKLTQSDAQVNGSVHVTNAAINRTTDSFRGVVSGDQFILREWSDLNGSFAVAGDRMAGRFTGVLC